jgi:two-component sensor histidine kinase
MTRFAATHPRQAVSLSIHAAPTEARALVDSLEIDLDAAQRHDLRLALTELVADSVGHGSTRADDRIDVQISVGGGVVRCEVIGEGLGLHVTNGRAEPPLSKSGAGGLIIVDRIAARWGTLCNGRSVWFELEAGA